MGKNQPADIEQPIPEPKSINLADFGIDATMVRDVIKPLIKDVAVNAVREAAGLGKRTDLRKGSKAYNIATFFKEITTPAIVLTVAAILIFTLTKLAWRWLGI